jgi:adenosyl cobinamide kinase/adenosyl cobinamide phosphate guanylyltransferase
VDHNLTFNLALVLGGARSGKSNYAMQLAGRFPEPRLYVATAEAADAEMAQRIEQHRRERGPQWDTREAPLELPAAIQAAQGKYRVMVVDCLTMWLSNLLTRGEAQPEMEAAGDSWMVRTWRQPPWEETLKELEKGCDHLVEVLGASTTPLVLVSNEVGCGIVPDNPLAREFRDRTGWLHQRLAKQADLVVLVVAGLPLVLKSIRG